MSDFVLPMNAEDALPRAGKGQSFVWNFVAVAGPAEKIPWYYHSKKYHGILGQ